MQKINTLIVATLLLILLVVVSACSNSSNAISELGPETQRTDDSSQSNESLSKSTSNPKNTNEQVDDNQEQTNNIDYSTLEDSTIETKSDEIQEANTTNTVTKIEGRKTEFLDRLDNIQKELDALQEKEGADKGATNAMKSYYGRSYEMYDKELNEIYALLKKELSPDTMEELNTEQLEWIEQKENKAEEERLEYNGGTFENVAWYISLYESTKERCYELVNEYMTD